jgi:uncharacterized protein (DUF697 family)
MTPVWLTAEFWTTMITNVIGIVVLVGGLTADQGTELTKALTTIAGGVIAALSAFGYVKGRLELKKSIVDLMGRRAESKMVGAADLNDELRRIGI